LVNGLLDVNLVENKKLKLAYYRKINNFYICTLEISCVHFGQSSRASGMHKSLRKNDSSGKNHQPNKK